MLHETLTNLFRLEAIERPLQGIGKGGDRLFQFVGGKMGILFQVFVGAIQFRGGAQPPAG